MQKILLIGYLGRNPEVRYSAQGTAIAQFSVATTERWKDKSGQRLTHTEWFAIKAFGRCAEIVGDYLAKGSRVYVEGRKRAEFWEDKQSGRKRSRDLLYADKVEFLDSQPKSGTNGSNSQSSKATGDDTTIADSDVPF